MKITISLPEDLVSVIDEKAAKLHISRSAYIATGMSEKIESEKVLEMLPEMIKTIDAAIKTPGLLSQSLQAGQKTGLERSSESEYEKIGLSQCDFCGACEYDPDMQCDAREQHLKELADL